jgi:hypothetical protein
VGLKAFFEFRVREGRLGFDQDLARYEARRSGVKRANGKKNQRQCQR